MVDFTVLFFRLAMFLTSVNFPNGLALFLEHHNVWPQTTFRQSHVEFERASGGVGPASQEGWIQLWLVMVIWSVVLCFPIKSQRYIGNNNWE